MHRHCSKRKSLILHLNPFYETKKKNEGIWIFDCILGGDYIRRSFCADIDGEEIVLSTRFHGPIFDYREGRSHCFIDWHRDEWLCCIEDLRQQKDLTVCSCRRTSRTSCLVTALYPQHPNPIPQQKLRVRTNWRWDPSNMRRIRSSTIFVRCATP